MRSSLGFHGRVSTSVSCLPSGALTWASPFWCLSFLPVWLSLFPGLTVLNVRRKCGLPQLSHKRSTFSAAGQSSPWGHVSGRMCERELICGLSGPQRLPQKNKTKQNKTKQKPTTKTVYVHTCVPVFMCVFCESVGMWCVCKCVCVLYFDYGRLKIFLATWPGPWRFQKFLPEISASAQSSTWVPEHWLNTVVTSAAGGTCEPPVSCTVGIACVCCVW
jgi:hypothetical protein